MLPGVLSGCKIKWLPECVGAEAASDSTAIDTDVELAIHCCKDGEIACSEVVLKARVVGA